MKIASTLRQCDMFGASISLKRDGMRSFVSTGGGLASIAIKVFILSFLCMQLIALVSYSDPQISSFTVLDSRDSMNKPITLDEME